MDEVQLFSARNFFFNGILVSERNRGCLIKILGCLLEMCCLFSSWRVDVLSVQYSELSYHVFHAAKIIYFQKLEIKL